MSSRAPASKKQRLESLPASSPLDDNFSDEDDRDTESGKGGKGGNLQAKKFQHCEVEKRRRERMNRYMAELAQMIPACSAVPRKLDKLSVLKMAVDHMKNLRGDPHSSSEYKPGFLTDDELKKLVVEAANGFMVIINCSQARVIYVSDAISDVMQEAPESWTGSCFYDLLHPKDIQKVKEQLGSCDVEEALASAAKQNTAKSPLVMHTNSMNGLRRSFLCRVKKSTSPTMQHADTSGKDYQKSEDVLRLLQSSQQSAPYEYAVLHCTGFIRNLTASERQSLKVEESASGACLVTVARLQSFGDVSKKGSMPTSDKEFISRVGIDGRFSYVDPRVAGVLGYLPQDLVGQVSYEYYHPEDIQKMVQLHHEAMKRRTPMPTVQYRFLSQSQQWVTLAMKAFSFVNPFSQQVEFVVCTNVTLPKPSDASKPSSSSSSSSSHPSLPLTLPEQSSAKQDRIEHFIRMTITQQAEQQMRAGQEGRGVGEMPDSLDSFLPNFEMDQPTNGGGPSGGKTPWGPIDGGKAPWEPSDGGKGPSFQENAEVVHKILEEYEKSTNPPSGPRKDLHYSFPPGLFSSEVDLEGSQTAYQYLLQGLDSPNDFQQLLVQVEANPMNSQNMFGDINFDIFD